MNDNTLDSTTKPKETDTPPRRRLRVRVPLPANINRKPEESESPLLSRAPAKLLSRHQAVFPRAAIIQTKLTVNEPDDQYEQEAEQVATSVMRMPSRIAFTAPPPEFEASNVSSYTNIPPIQAQLIARLHAAREEAMQEAPTVTPAIENRIASMNGSGNPLPDSERSFFESRMGADFSDVRIHTGTNAVQTSRDLNARAFTVGNNVAFNAGEYAPGTSAGRHLLAHELTHVVQQGGGRQIQKEEQTTTNELPNEPGEVMTPSAGTVKLPIQLNHPGQWYDMDRQVNPRDPNRTFWKASVYNTLNMNHDAYKTVAQRHAFYDFADAYLNTQDQAIRSQWFQAAAIVTQRNAIGAADQDTINLWYLSDNTEEFLRAGNEFLFKYNMKNFSHLMQGEDIPGMENLRGKALDDKLVEFEQSKVQDFIDNYRPSNGEVNEIVDEINDSFDSMFAPSTVKEVIQTRFEGAKFDFNKYEDRVTLGKGLIELLHES